MGRGGVWGWSKALNSRTLSGAQLFRAATAEGPDWVLCSQVSMAPVLRDPACSSEGIRHAHGTHI